MVDLVDTQGTGEPVMMFESEKDLSEYTQRTKKYFPQDNAYAGGVLKHLLRHITSPREVVPKKTSSRGQKGKRGRQKV